MSEYQKIPPEPIKDLVHNSDEQEMSQRAVESVRFPGVRWSPADLDRCAHGRHSTDSCFDCPGGKSEGNKFLNPLAGTRETRMDRNQIRIGTMVHGEPIWVTYRSSDG